MASIFAAAQLKNENRLPVNVVFLIEGAEESGIGMSKRGLDNIVKANAHWFSNPSVI